MYITHFVNNNNNKIFISEIIITLTFLLQIYLKYESRKNLCLLLRDHFEVTAENPPQWPRGWNASLICKRWSIGHNRLPKVAGHQHTHTHIRKYVSVRIVSRNGKRSVQTVEIVRHIRQWVVLWWGRSVLVRTQCKTRRDEGWDRHVLLFHTWRDL